MPNSLVWDDKTNILLGEVIYAHHYLFVDWSKVDSNLQTALTYQVTLRVAGVDCGDATVAPLANSAVGSGFALQNLVNGVGPVTGEIDDFCVKNNAGDVVAFTDATATDLHFLIVGKANAVVPISILTAAVPALGGLVGVLAELLGTKVNITIGHFNVDIAITRDRNGRITAINKDERS
jgi:hypothetical protein